VADVIRALVVDDEPLARRTLRILLAREPDFEIVGECGSGRAAVAAIREVEPDVLFLDIQLPDRSGFDVLRELMPDETPFVVFVTAYDEHALRAFEVNALAYLLKPFDDLRFGEVLDRIRGLVRSDRSAAARPSDLAARIRAVLQEEASGEPGPHERAGTADPRSAAAATLAGPARDRLVVRSGARTHLVPVAEIAWIEAEGNYARLHLVGGEVQHLVPHSLADIVALLAPRGFVRIHRSAAVSVDRVRELRTENRRDFTVLLEGGETLRLSRTYREALERALGGRI
jgi:two-component system LytT family response regulator